MINQFLASVKLLNGIKRLVLGNPTADMDSCIGSILLAYHMNQTQLPTAPVINFDRKKFASHFEITELFDSNNLIFISEVDLHQYELILYDHNDIQYTNNQIGCVDHHEDKGYEFSSFKIINKVGSAITLVSEIMDINKNYKNEEIAQLIMKTILLDTFNFQQKQYQIRWNDRDKLQFDICHSIIPKFNINATYEYLTHQKYNIKANLALSLQDLLYKDYKKFNIVGYAVIFVKLEQILEQYDKDYILKQFDEFMNTEQCKTLIVFFVTYNNGEVERTMLIYGENQQNILQKLQELQVEQIQTLLPKTIFLKDINNIYSRKIIEPLIS